MQQTAHGPILDEYHGRTNIQRLHTSETDANKHAEGSFYEAVEEGTKVEDDGEEKFGLCYSRIVTHDHVANSHE
jgi:hypothetical protein